MEERVVGFSSKKIKTRISAKEQQMNIINLLEDLNPFDEVNVFAETMAGLQPLYSGLVGSIEKGVRKNWSDGTVVGIWLYRTEVNIVIADRPDYIKVPKRLIKTLIRAQACIDANINEKTF